jgi:aryl-alcohol dehydrogenase-like predicted oxidoreductase
MKYGRIAHVDKDVSRIGQGLMMMSEDRLDEGFAILDAALEAGITFFDSAHMYGGGACDRVFGAWVRERGVRERVVLFDKGCHHVGETNRVTPECIAEDVGTILGNTGFDYIDIFAFHRDDESVPVGPLVEKLNELIREGKIRAFGGSNWTHERIREANEYAEAKGLQGFSAASPQWSLCELIDEPWGRGSVTLSGDGGREAREWYEANRMAVVPWSSLGGGFFTGNFRRDNLDSFEGGGEKRCVRCYCGEDNFKRYDRADELARERGASVPQIALAYLVTGPLNSFPLMAAYDPDMARENAAAADIELTPEERAWLDLRSGAR